MGPLEMCPNFHRSKAALPSNLMDLKVHVVEIELYQGTNFCSSVNLILKDIFIFPSSEHF